MSKCGHKLCGREKRVWIPCGDDNSRSIEKHPWCTRCGLVKNISEDRPHKMGYWMNLLSFLSEVFDFTQVQKRLMAREIQQNEYLDDDFGAFGSSQKESFKNIICRYSKIDKRTIEQKIKKL
ncbi:MAG: hypothetical protein V5A68_08065 [Candidatus Thermoplasmatota archaeon]